MKKIEIVFPEGYTVKPEKIAGGIRLTISRPTEMIGGKVTSKPKPSLKSTVAPKKAGTVLVKTKPAAYKLGKPKAKAKAKKKRTGSTGPRITG
jgi:hypothetical protein